MINTIYFTKDKAIIAQGVYSKRIPKIKKQVIIDLPENCVVDGEILDMVKLSHLLSTTLKKEKMKTTSVIFGIQNKNISAINLTFPNVKKQLLQTVEMRLSESYIGITEGNYISYKLDKIEGNMCSGFATVTPKAILDSYYTLSMNIECKLVGIDYLGNVMQKILLMNEKEFSKKTYMVVDATNDDVYAYLYSNGSLAMTRNENGTSIYGVEAPDEEEFMFDSRIPITDEDQEIVRDRYKDLSAGLEDLSSFMIAQHVYYKRYIASDKNTQEEISSIMFNMKTFEEILESLKLTVKKPMDFDQVVENVHLTNNRDLLTKMQKCKELLNKFKVLECPFEIDIENYVSDLISKVQSIVEVFEKYFVLQTDQKRIERKQLIQRLCQVSINLVRNADFSGDYTDVEDLYVLGLNLNSKEKKIIENNLNVNYVINIHNYETYLLENTSLSIGLLNNDASVGNDLDLAISMEKNDRINRTNYDNILFGIGGIGLFAVFTIVALSGYYYFSTSQMNQKINVNEKFIADNQEVFKLVDKKNELTNQVNEVKNYEDYFEASNTNLSAIEKQFSGLSNSVKISDLSIDDSFLITMKVGSDNLTNISKYTETLFAEGYTDATYKDIVLNQEEAEKVIATVTFKYVNK